MYGELDTKLKSYNKKILHNRNFILDCIYILIMFVVTQVLSIIICINLMDNNIVATIAIIGILNFIFYRMILFN